jgi:hypothetical protein
MMIRFLRRVLSAAFSQASRGLRRIRISFFHCTESPVWISIIGGSELHSFDYYRFRRHTFFIFRVSRAHLVMFHRDCIIHVNIDFHHHAAVLMRQNMAVHDVGAAIVDKAAAHFEVARDDNCP